MSFGGRTARFWKAGWRPARRRQCLYGKAKKRQVARQVSCWGEWPQGPGARAFSGRDGLSPGLGLVARMQGCLWAWVTAPVVLSCLFPC